MLCYFAEPIDQYKFDTAEEDFKRDMIDAIHLKGYTTFRPYDAWEIPTTGDKDSVPHIESVNRDALRRANIMVARLPKGSASIGVPMEIEFATRTLKIPVIVVGVGGVSLEANPLVTVINSNDIVAFKMALHTVRPVEIRDFAKSESNLVYHTGVIKPRTYPGDAGIDLITTETKYVKPGEHAMIPTGVNVQIPEGTFGWIVARSSTYKNYGLIVLPGIIDEGYTGELFASVHNTKKHEVWVKPGSRICQLLIMPNLMKGMTTVQVDQIETRDRGSSGFGSTGR